MMEVATAAAVTAAAAVASAAANSPRGQPQPHERTGRGGRTRLVDVTGGRLKRREGKR